MGLDQYAFTRKKDEKDTQIMQWRKHADLEGWMSDLYYEKGGEADVFNCVELSLTKDDLLRLKDVYQHLEQASGFFWGTSVKSDEVQTGDFIESAIQAIDDGYEVIYTSWW
tara:strand:+ start:943 stop:1275 length:333 start_codon:yes stop_codon:yes gene_type:complete